MSIRSLSVMDHTNQRDTEDMDYLIQPRGPGTGWVFRMVTPPSLIGQPNPWEGRVLGREIKRGLGTRVLKDARKHRDILLGDIRRLQHESTEEGRWSLKRALEWREDTRDLNSETTFAHNSILGDDLQRAEQQGVPQAKLTRFARVAFGKGFPLSEALQLYKADRSEGNPRGYATLAKTTVLNLDTAVRHLRNFLKDEAELACLEDVTADHALRFKDEFLPSVQTGRGRGSMSAATINKNITLLRAVWNWATERRLVAAKYKNPWIFDRGVPRAKKVGQSRQDYQPDETAKLLKLTKRGTREGDLFRLALATGCRADEIASLPASAVRADGGGFEIASGKTQNATRFIPCVGEAQALLIARMRRHAATGRLFPEWPLRPGVEKAYAVSQWFTRFRREALGEETDGRLALHSTRHTWRTVARRARVHEADINELGGWSGTRSSNAVYDHGLLEHQLVEAQQKVWDELQRAGYLEGF